MGDSDDEQEKGRGRDKFRRERSDYSNGGEKGRSRSDHREKRWRDDSDSFSSRRRSREEYDGDNRRRFSAGSGYGRGGRDWSPPAKRMRRDQWSGFPVPEMMMPYGMRPPWAIPPHSLPPAHHQISPGAGLSADSPSMGGALPHGHSRHVMLTFKQFLTRQEDDIDESAAIVSYNEYKVEFKKRMMEEFFEKHKEEDWFISKYHPKNMSQSKELDVSNLQSRLRAFLFLMESGQVDSMSVSMENQDDVVKVMDSAVIKMEGGTDLDLISLEQSAQRGENSDGKMEDTDDQDKKETSPFLTMEQTEEARKLAEQAKEYGKLMKGGKKRSNKKRDTYSDDKDENISESSSDNESSQEEDSRDSKAANEPPPPGMEMEAAVSSPRSSVEDSGTGLLETGKPVKTPGDQQLSPSENGRGLITPRPLHITHSVYIRHIPPKISSENIVEVCRTISGFLRIAFAEPNPEKGYERRGWVTYRNETDIKDVLSRLSTKKIKDCHLHCIQNRELTRRVKQSPTATWTRKAVQTDLQLALKLIKVFDEKTKLWENASSPSETGEASQQTNPLLTFHESVLDDEEEEMVSMATGGDDEEGVIRDPATEIMGATEKVKLLDNFLWYLRLVHSLDYYSMTVFPIEDSMPHRCGIFTIRPTRPNSVGNEDVTDYVENVAAKVKPLLQNKQFLSESDMNKFGKKDIKAEVERFIELNTQMISENKYLCPLSGKKFKGPDFVRKHIFNKHTDKVEAFKQEAEFFNNYIRDPDRPVAQEATIGSAILPSTVPKTPGGDESPSDGPPGMLGASGSPWGRGGVGMGMFGRGGFGPAMGGFPPDMMARGSGFRPPRGGRRGRGRRVINYQDLDAPEEMY